MDFVQNGAGDAAIKTEDGIDMKPILNVKSEIDGLEVSEGRPTRKRKVNISFAEQDSDEDDEDYGGKGSAKKKRGGATTPRGRGRGRGKTALPENLADPSKSPRIVLESIDTDGKAKRGGKGTPRGGGRGRGRGGTPRSTAKSKKKVSESDEEDEEMSEEEQPDDSENDEDFNPDGDDDEDFAPPSKKKGGRQARQTPAKPRKAPAPKKQQKKKKDEDSDFEAEEEEDEGDEDDEGEGGENGTATETVVNTDPNAIKTGQYLIEKSDMRRLENYPIWRMEGPNMLRKFEMIVQDGKIRHKSLYAYSSWAQSMVEQYEKIQIKQISSQDGETVVEVQAESKPQPPDIDGLEIKFSQNNLLPLYSTYVRAMLRQALDHTFLNAIKENNDQSYLVPIMRIDEMIKERIQFIETQVNMKDDFKSRVASCPNMRSIKRQNWSQTDQATVDKSAEKGVRSVLLFGYGYDPFLLEEDKSKGVEVAQEVVIGDTMEQFLMSYHGLTHFKYHLLQRCNDKVKLLSALNKTEQPEAIMEMCMNDKTWFYLTFEDMTNLMANENLSNMSKSQ